MLRISTITEALSALDKLTGRTWTDSELFDLTSHLGIELHASAPITAKVIVQELVKGKGLVAKFGGMPTRASGLASLLPWQVSQLWVSGETLANRAYSGGDREEEGEYILFDEPVRVTREQVRIRSETLQYIIKIWQNAQSGRWIKDNSAPEGMRYQSGPAWMFPLPSAAPTAPKKEAESTNAKSTQVKINKLRRNSLDPAIDKAINLAGNTKLADVYLQLKELAMEEVKPFTGSFDGGALCYTDDNDQPAKLTKNALGKRLKWRSE